RFFLRLCLLIFALRALRPPATEFPPEVLLACLVVPERGLNEPLIVGLAIRNKFTVLKIEANFTDGCIYSIRSMNKIVLHAETEVSANRAHIGFRTVGGTIHLADLRHGVGTFPYHLDRRAGGNEGNQVAKEGLVGMLFIMFLGNGVAQD